MKTFYLLLSINILFILSNIAIAQPEVNRDTISWPSSYWYQVQRTYAQGQNPVDWNICNSNNGVTSCQVPNGTYTVQKQGGNPWRVLETWDNVVVENTTVTEPEVDEPEVAELEVDGNTILWPNNYWYQVQRTYAQGQNPVDWNVCNSNNGMTSCTVPNGTYTVQKQGGNPWRVLETWDNIVVGDDENNNESATYQEVFTDHFNGTSVSSNFYVPSWNVDGRDTTNNISACSQSGGVLNLSIQNAGNERQACYLISNVNNYGPGDVSTLKIEYRANVSMVQAEGAWFAGWIYSLDRNSDGQLNSEDGKLDTGAEYDVFEYMPTNPNGFNTAVHDGDDGPQGLEHWTYPAGSYAIDLTQNKYHTYTVEWNKNCMVFSIDGNKVYTNTSYVSQAKVHSIMLPMEAETDIQWNFWPVGNFASNLETSPAVGKVDWLKIWKKDSIDPNLCQ